MCVCTMLYIQTSFRCKVFRPSQPTLGPGTKTSCVIFKKAVVRNVYIIHRTRVFKSTCLHENRQGSNWRGFGGFNPPQFPCSFHCDPPTPLVPAVLLALPVNFSQFEPWKPQFTSDQLCERLWYSVLHRSHCSALMSSAIVILHPWQATTSVASLSGPIFFFIVAPDLPTDLLGTLATGETVSRAWRLGVCRWAHPLPERLTWNSFFYQFPLKLHALLTFAGRTGVLLYPRLVWRLITG